MKEGWYWDRIGPRSQGRWFIRDAQNDPCALSIIRRKGSWYVIDDDKEEEGSDLCPVLAGPMPLRAAKVAYIINVKEHHFGW